MSKIYNNDYSSYTKMYIDFVALEDNSFQPLLVRPAH